MVRIGFQSVFYIRIHSMYIHVTYKYQYYSTRTRRGGSCLRFDCKTFFIYRTCMRRAPCVRALCELVALLLSKNVTGVRPRCNATSSEHFLHTSHCTLHTPHFTLHSCTSHSTAHLISNHLISSHLVSPHLTSSHLIPSLPTCHLSKFFSTVFISSEHWKKSSQLISALTVRAKPFAQKTLSAQKLETQMHLDRKILTTYFLLDSLHKVLPSTTLYYKACTKYFPLLLCTTKLAQSTSQYFLYYKACAKRFPVLLCTTKLAQSTSQYYFVV